MPKGTAAGVAKALHAATISALEIPSVQQRFKALGANDGGRLLSPICR